MYLKIEMIGGEIKEGIEGGIEGEIEIEGIWQEEKGNMFPKKEMIE